MNLHFIKYSLGKLLQLLSFFMFIPATVAFFESNRSSFISTMSINENLPGFLIAIVLSFFTGTLLTLLPKKYSDEKTIREGFTIVTLGWLLLTFFGCIPLFFYFINTSGSCTIMSVGHCFTDAFFEVMSGFTTTGATIIVDVEKLPDSLLLWRGMTQWLGGMGIVTLGLAIFPTFGIAAYQLFRGEVPGPTAERLTPSLSQTAKILWGVYALLTLVEVMLLFFCGMSPLDAICHSFATMSTGGFSTKNLSIAAYNNAAIDWIVMLFMFFGGINFIIHYNVIFFHKWSAFISNHEFRFYFFTIIIAIGISVAFLQIHGVSETNDVMRNYRSTPITIETAKTKISLETQKIESLHDKIRHSAFQVVSIITTTGFFTADFDIWPGALRTLLVILMFFGGCAGSTAGGIKIVRIIVIFKSSLREIRSLIQPRQIISVRIADKTLDEKQIRTISGFFSTFMICTVFFILATSLIIPDITTATSAVIACICNVGPGLSGVGPLENYSWIPNAGKWILSFCMLLGRLELYTVLIALSPATWRR